MKDFIYILIYPDNSIKEVDNDIIIDELYYKLARVPTLKELKTKYEKLDQSYLDELKINISKNKKYVPLFDINSKNIYIINTINIFYRIMECDYRLPDEKTISILKNTLMIYESKKERNQVIELYIEKLKKNIVFLDCYNLNVLKNTYYEIFYQTSPATREITNCIKPSYFSFLSTTKPYFTLSQLYMMAKNMNLELNLENINDVCKIVQENDIDGKNLLKHHLYITGNNAKNYIQLYTLLGAYYLNEYIRKENSIRDIILEKHIKNIWKLINKAPSFNKSYYVYRFVEEDDYIKHLKVNDIYHEESFISTTRNPFYNPKHNVFGFILLKIKLPANIEGVGLCVETHSLFNKEEEILLSPGRLKLVGIDNDFHFYHTDKAAENKIKKKYEFEYLGPIKTSPIEKTKNYKHLEGEIPILDFSKIIIDGYKFEEKIMYFFDKLVKNINGNRYFYSKIGKETYLFQIYYLDASIIYEKYFFLQQSKKKLEDELYIIIQDLDTAKIKLFIEIRDVISVNYIFRYVGSEKYFKDEELLLFLAYLARSFNINQVIIHDNYISYEAIAEKRLDEANIKDFDMENPDTDIVNLYSGYSNYYPEEIINYMTSLSYFFGKTEYIPKYHNQPGIEPVLKYHMIESLMNINTEVVLSIRERTPLYRIFQKNKEKYHKFLEFYLFIHYNYFYLLKELNERINQYLIEKTLSDVKEINPWLNNYFYFDPKTFLYEKDILPLLPKTNINLVEKYIKKISEENLALRKSRYRQIYDE